MNSTIFNISLALGWLLIIVGVWGLHSWAAGLLAGGAVLMAVTLLLAILAGVRATKRKDSDVSE
jgi:hypothetical protein